MKLVLKIAAGIILAYALMSAGGLAVTAYTVHLAKKELQEFAAKQEAEQLEAQRQIVLAKQAKAARQRQAEAQAKQRNQKKLARQRAERELDRAFLAQYETPTICINPPSDAAWVNCVDARKEAKAVYADQQVLLSAPHEDISIESHTP
jgi:non-ribosomal peptide synthetase component E (peptide arylation enzyme)